MIKRPTLAIFAGLVMLALFNPAFAGKLTLDETMDIARCTNQWDFMISADFRRRHGYDKEKTRKEMLEKYIRSGDKEPYRSVVTDAINSAVDYVYKINPIPQKYSRVMSHTHQGFMACLKSHQLTRYQRELKLASLRASLVTFWDYFRRKGYKKEQILAISKNLTPTQRKLLDAVYQPNFRVAGYRIQHIWTPVSKAIIKKYH